MNWVLAGHVSTANWDLFWNNLYLLQFTSYLKEDQCVCVCVWERNRHWFPVGHFRSNEESAKNDDLFVGLEDSRRLRSILEIYSETSKMDWRFSTVFSCLAFSRWLQYFVLPLFRYYVYYVHISVYLYISHILYIIDIY